MNHSEREMRGGGNYAETTDRGEEAFECVGALGDFLDLPEEEVVENP